MINKIIITLIITLFCHTSFASERWQVVIDEKSQISILDRHNNNATLSHRQYMVKKCEQSTFILPYLSPADHWSVLDITGKTILTGKTDDILSVQLSCSGVIAPENHFLGFTPFKGEKVTAVYNEIYGSRIDGLFIVKRFDPEDHMTRMGVINGNGKLIIEPDYHLVMINDDHIKVSAPGKKENLLSTEGLFDLDGKVLVPIGKYQTAEWINEDKLAKVSQVKEDGLNYYGLLDTKGNALIPIQFRSIYYHDKIAHVITHFETNDQLKYGLYNFKTGTVLPPKYSSIGQFVNGIATIGYFSPQGNRWGLLDEDANEIVPPIYEIMFYDDNQQYAEVRLNKKYGMIGPKGEIMVPMIFDKFTEYQPIKDKDGIVIGQNQQGYAVYNFRTGKALLPLKNYDMVMRTYTGFMYRVDDKTVHFAPDGTEIIK